MVTGHQAAEVEALLQPTGVRFVRQEPPQGTGHALECCRAALGDAPGLLDGALRRYAAAFRRDAGASARGASSFRRSGHADHHRLSTILPAMAA